ncbi:MAG: radical SAM protein [Clostridia bacterium]|nr:radical SAM protein [Clostridia bacterium]
MNDIQKNCTLCPRNCGVDRTLGQTGFCGGGADAQVAKVMLHRWEEPCVSGSGGEADLRDGNTGGSGAVFFTHCSLGCLYCQNRDISGRHSTAGKTMTPRELADVFLELQDKGAYNINLVTPTHYAAQIAGALRMAKENGLTLPVIWNTGGYESAAVLDALAGLVDVYLTDFKYADSAPAELLSHAPDYPDRAAEALAVMIRQTGAVQFDERGMLRRGVLLRHLCLPGYRKDSIAVLRRAAQAVDPSDVRLSLMRQYTPDFLREYVAGCPGAEVPKSLLRRVTEFEYQSVVEEAMRLGFDGYTQEKESAVRGYTPAFLEK